MAVTIEQLKDVKDAAQEALGNVSEKIMDADVVQHLAPVRIKRRARRGRRIVVLLLIGIGAGVAVSICLRKRNEQRLPDVAPDAFGAGVMQQNGGDPMLIGSRTPDME